MLWRYLGVFELCDIILTSTSKVSFIIDISAETNLIFPTDKADFEHAVILHEKVAWIELDVAISFRPNYNRLGFSVAS